MQQPIVVAGSTATGKTELAVAIAKTLGNVELINADSRQLLRTLHVGTCTPTPVDLDGIACHCLDLFEPGIRFSVADWLTSAKTAISDINSRGLRPLIVGGTGLYIRALVDGFDLAAVAPNPERRLELDAIAATAEGRGQLAARIKLADPAAAMTMDLNNPRRLTRAIEVLENRGTLTEVRGRAISLDAIWLGLDVAPELHRQWIQNRSEHLIRDGALRAEVEGALRGGLGADVISSAAIGYREILAVMNGEVSDSVAVEQVAQRTRRYAKAQRTWFRKEARINWLAREDGRLPLAEAQEHLFAHSA